MPVSLSCKGCKSTLKVREDLAGKKVKCPKCSNILVVPTAAKEEVEDIEVLDDRIQDQPIAKGAKKPSAKQSEREPSKADRGIQAKKSSPKKGGNKRDEDDEDRPSRAQFKPCPRCGESGAKRVLWTPWGSFYGPALFTHVRCPECSFCYNGKTGGSNLIPAIIFFTVPLIGILCIIGGIFYMLWLKNYL